MKTKTIAQLASLVAFGLFASANHTQADLGDLGEPAASCYLIKVFRPAATDGLYWLQAGSMTAPEQYYCDMTTDGGGWQLAFQRRGGTNTAECGANLNEFLHAGACGSVSDLAYNRSYNPGDVSSTFNNFQPREYLFKQLDSGLNLDSDETFIIHTANNLFPDSPSASVVHDIPAEKICDINNANCDDTDVYWKYIGRSWFHSARCIAGNAANNPALPGNYGYCHDGWNNQAANSLFGNRDGYNETKLWSYGGASRNYAERVFIRSTPPVFDEITTESDNPKNSAYAKEGDRVRITIRLVEPTTWRYAYNKPTFSIGSTTGLQTISYVGSSTPKQEGYRSYIISNGQNGTFTFTALDFQDGNNLDILNFNAPYIPAGNVTVDTILPNIVFLDDVFNGETLADTIRISVTDVNEDASSYRYGFSADATCDETDSYPNNFTSGVGFIINDSTHNGQYICVRAEDQAGNVAYRASAFPLNVVQKTATPTSAPDLRSVSDSGVSDSDDITNDTTPTITGGCIAGSEVKIYLEGVATADTATCDAGGQFEITLSGSLTDGVHRVSYTQDDAVPNLVESDQSPQLEISVDTIDPYNLNLLVDIEAPYDLDNPQITFSALDGESGIGYYTVAADGGAATTQVSPYEPSLAPATSHEIVVTVYDVAGNSISRTTSYPPVVNINAPTTIANSAITDTAFEVLGPNPIEEIEITGTAAYSNLVCDKNPTPATPESPPINCTIQVDSTGTLIIKATSDLGATGESSQDYIIEADQPDISFTNDVESDPVQADEITIRVAEDNPDITSYQYGFSADDVCDASDSYSEDFTSEATFAITDDSHNGEYICVQAADKAGNVAYQASQHPLRIDLIAPVITLEGDNPQVLTLGGTYQGQTFSAEDNEDGNLTASVLVDESNVRTDQAGEYLVIYTVTDRAGNVGQRVRRVLVEAPTPTPDPQPNPQPSPEPEEVCSSSIGNTIWLDNNHNQKKDLLEKGIEDITVKLKDQDGNTIKKDKTNSRGKYKFKDLDQGTYTVVVSKKDTQYYIQTYDPSGAEMNNKTTVHLGCHDKHTKADFGFSDRELELAQTGGSNWRSDFRWFFYRR